MTNQFIEIPAGKKSIRQRRPVYGVGINDAKYQVMLIVGMKQITCPYYSKWTGMLKRCYSDRHLKTHPTYEGCFACKEWLTFSKFKAWMQKQDWQGKELDKDIKVTGNKMYSSDTCIFVTAKINTLLNNNAADRGEWPQGVCFDKKLNKFKGHCKVNGKLKHLGVFLTPESASEAYKQFKSKLILSIAEEQDQPLKGYLIRIAKEYQ